MERELAAYALDRLLRLGLVPATVARSYDGASGVLQGRPANWASEQDRQNAASGTRAGLACQAISAEPKVAPMRRPLAVGAVPPRLPTGGYCDVNAQYQLSYAFDALIGNQARTLDRYLYDLDPSMQARGLSLVLSGHGSAFGAATQLPPQLEAALAKTGPEMQSRLRQLDAANVKGAIGQWVGDRDIKALLARRDRILELARSVPHAEEPASAAEYHRADLERARGLEAVHVARDDHDSEFLEEPWGASPVNRRCCASNLSHGGSGPPSASRADRCNTSPGSASMKASSAITCSSGRPGA